MSDWSPVKPVTSKVENICSKIKSQVQEKAKAQFDVYIPVDFISTNEHGVNYTYVVKVDVGGDKCVHAKIFEAGGGELILQDTLYPKTPNEPLNTSNRIQK